jgi:hypothetical protein
MQDLTKKTRLEVRIEHSDLYNREVIKVGKYELAMYYKFSNCMEFIGAIIPSDPELFGEFKFNEENKKYYKRDKYKWFADKAGCSAYVLMQHVNKLLYKFYVGKYDNFHIKKFCLNPMKKKVDNSKLLQMNACSEILDQVKKDNIYNIAPYVFYLNRNPSDLRKEFGKGPWKRLCKLSFHKNTLLANRKYVGINTIDDDIPSSILKNVSMYMVDREDLIWIRDNLKGKWTNKREVQKYETLLHDTKLMAERYDLEFSYKWNPEKLQQKHDEFIAESRKNRTYVSDKVFDWYDTWKVKDLTEGEYTVKLLKSQKEIVDEGNRMHHCVGSYADYCKKKSYMIYSVEKNGVKYSTIGLSYDERVEQLHKSQHYMACNQAVDCPIADELPDLIIQKFYKEENLD